MKNTDEVGCVRAVRGEGEETVEVRRWEERRGEERERQDIVNRRQEHSKNTYTNKMFFKYPSTRVDVTIKATQRRQRRQRGRRREEMINIQEGERARGL